MPFTFKPGQAPVDSNGVPVLVVPEAPVISMAAPVEVISPLAYRNRSNSKFGVYFQGVVFLIFGLTILVTIGLFVYKGILSARINGKADELAAAQQGMEKLNLEELQNFSNKLKVVNRVMGEHASVNTAFKILQKSIHNPVTYTKFNLTKNKSKAGYSLSFSGETSSYDLLYQQIEALKSKKFSNGFSKIEISGFGPLDKKGIGTFKAEATINIAGVDPDNWAPLSELGVGTTTKNSSTSTPVVNDATVASSSPLSIPPQ